LFNNNTFLNLKGGLVLKLSAKLLCGGFAGAIAQSFACKNFFVRKNETN
jgi:hypothetical protein